MIVPALVAILIRVHILELVIALVRVLVDPGLPTLVPVLVGVPI